MARNWPEALLKHIRTNFDDFVDRRNSTFPPLDNTIDKPVWESDNPLGAVLNIQVNVGDLLGRSYSARVIAVVVTPAGRPDAVS